ncbi:hypothetical protein [Pseudanabaena sp. PCC 6802]|uniref:hypothetical protein n=1 Tax=Pseudanabaena sp. PCC 6802 TaxID=118173 RepID=UPI00034ADBF7|nr:hypothetical protein [Pseudanabaena sp. PCC 6802]
MASPNLRSSGILSIAAGLLFGGFMFFHPANTPQGALEDIWVPVHATWLISYLLIICSFLPLYQAFIAARGLLPKVGYYLAFLGTVLSLPIAVWDSFVVPYLAKHAPDFIAQIEEISMETPVLVFRIVFFLTVLAFSLGFVLYGIAAVRLLSMPMLGGICLAVGAPTFWAGALFFSQGALGNLVTEMGAVLFAIGLVSLGATLLTKSIDGEKDSLVASRG